MAVVSNSLNKEPFTILLKNTMAAYEHANAPTNKYGDNSRALSLNLALVTVSHKNLSQRAITDVNLALNEIMLLNNDVYILNRCVLFFGKYIALPSIKWLFSLVSALIIALIVVWVKTQG
ncbi:MAG: hypothetical protein HRU25_13140 [Psychrobium sp.]|nr:hypothetical protein [Psychrobium sp.]